MVFMAFKKKKERNKGKKSVGPEWALCFVEA